jgi:hypothetical protein
MVVYAFTGSMKNTKAYIHSILLAQIGNAGRFIPYFDLV